MPDILQRVGIQASPDTVYSAITTIDGLAGWWTTDTRGETGVGGKIKFTFGDKGFFEMKILELKPSSHVLWEVVDGVRSPPAAQSHRRICRVVVPQQPRPDLAIRSAL